MDQTVKLLGSTSHVWGSKMDLRETGVAISAINFKKDMHVHVQYT